MEPQHEERRLTTILASDVVGYSRLMAADEAGTFARLKARRKELIEPKTAEYHGCIGTSPKKRRYFCRNSIIHSLVSSSVLQVSDHGEPVGIGSQHSARGHWASRMYLAEFVQ